MFVIIVKVSLLLDPIAQAPAMVTLYYKILKHKALRWTKIVWKKMFSQNFPEQLAIRATLLQKATLQVSA